MAARSGVWMVVAVLVAAAVAPAPASAECAGLLRESVRAVPVRGSVLAYRQTARGEWPPQVRWWGAGSARISTLSPNMAWIEYAGEHGAELTVFARRYSLSSRVRPPGTPQVLSLEESLLHDVCRDVVYTSDPHPTPPDRSSNSYVALLAALLLALAFAVARMTPQVALEGVRGRATCTRRGGDATPLPRTRLVDRARGGARRSARASR